MPITTYSEPRLRFQGLPICMLAYISIIIALIIGKTDITFYNIVLTSVSSSPDAPDICSQMILYGFFDVFYDFFSTV